MADAEHRTHWRFDRTINLPTLVSVAMALGGAAWWGSTVEQKAAQALEVAQETKSTLRAQTLTNAEQMSAMRTELRAELKDVGQKVDQIIWRLSSPPRNLQEWTQK